MPRADHCFENPSWQTHQESSCYSQWSPSVSPWYGPIVHYTKCWALCPGLVAAAGRKFNVRTEFFKCFSCPYSIPTIYWSEGSWNSNRFVIYWYLPSIMTRNLGTTEHRHACIVQNVVNECMEVFTSDYARQMTKREVVRHLVRFILQLLKILLIY